MITENHIQPRTLVKCRNLDWPHHGVARSSWKLLVASPVFLLLALVIFACSNLTGKPRARDLGIPFKGNPGNFNAITDVRGVTVGHTTIVFGNGKLRVGEGPARTGVTVIFPLGSETLHHPVFAGWFSLNGNGEMTGTAWVEESGFLEGPVLLTNTHSVGIVHHSAIKWRTRNGHPPDTTGYWWSLPVVAETWDGHLNDINGFHVTEEHVFAALESAISGPVAEGNVGSGTGMICYEFKGGIGTASRVLDQKEGGYTVGVLVQANCGLRHQLTIAGVPVGREISEETFKRGLQPNGSTNEGSIIIIVATDAPVLPHQLKRISRRAAIGLARTGSVSSNSSGDLFIAFSTASPKNRGASTTVGIEMLKNDRIDPLFSATVQATEEAIINALIAAETMVGRDDHRIIALPHDRLQNLLRRYGRLQ